MPVDDAIARGVYGAWTPSDAERARLEEIFPDGVCDWSRGDVGRPGRPHRHHPWPNGWHAWRGANR
jgi:hypothetical protein